ncbi:MAG: STAS/SEC14 domain-containing protein [Bacteroidota bacterium]
METLYTHPLYEFQHLQAENVLKLDWETKTATMTDQEFMDALSNFAGYAFECGAPGLLLDVRDFRYLLSEQLNAWRDTHIVSRYMKAGCKKMAYLTSTATLARIEKKEVAMDGFTYAYFDTEEEAIAWLIS